MNRMPITVATRRRATRWAAVSLSAIALPLAVLSAPVAIQSARAHLSSRTVDNHLGRIYAKLGLSSRLQLATWFAQSANRESNTPQV